MELKEKTVLFFATGCYLGYIPFAPGTFGTLLAVPICMLMALMTWTETIIFMILFIFFAIWISHYGEKYLKKKDPGCIVIDEIAGMMLALATLPLTPLVFFSGFMLFRCLDILKPFPISAIDKRLSGGLGIVCDDLAAGLLTHLILRGMLVWVPFFTANT